MKTLYEILADATNEATQRFEGLCKDPGPHREAVALALGLQAGALMRGLQEWDYLSGLRKRVEETTKDDLFK